MVKKQTDGEMEKEIECHRYLSNRSFHVKSIQFRKKSCRIIFYFDEINVADDVDKSYKLRIPKLLSAFFFSIELLFTRVKNTILNIF